MPEAAVVKPANAPVAKPLTDEERRKLYEDLRQRMAESPLKVAPPSGVTAYWAKKDNLNEMSRLDILGFKVVHEPDRSHLRFKANGLKEDGTYQLGDVILMEIPTDYYEFYDAELRERARALAEGGKGSFKQEAAKAGVPTFDVKRGE